MLIFGRRSPWGRKTGRLGSWPTFEPRETRGRSTPREKLELRTDGFQGSFLSEMKISTKYILPVYYENHSVNSCILYQRVNVGSIN